MLRRSGCIPSIWGLLLGAAVFFLCFAPVPVLSLEQSRPGEDLLFLRHLSVPGEPVVTRYLHSVQKTWVEDEYYLSHGLLWQWDERVKSHNAGLPFSRRPRGRFFQDVSWMHFQGSGEALPLLVVRVGTFDLGRNELLLFGEKPRLLFQEMPRSRMVFRPEVRSLLAWGAECFLAHVSGEE